MTLDQYIQTKGSKYAVISKERYEQDPVALSLTDSPREFLFDGVPMVVISLDPLTVPELVQYAKSVSNGVEFELTLGTSKVTLLTHTAILKILEQQESQE